MVTAFAFCFMFVLLNETSMPFSFAVSFSPADHICWSGCWCGTAYMFRQKIDLELHTTMRKGFEQYKDNGTVNKFIDDFQSQVGRAPKLAVFFFYILPL